MVQESLRHKQISSAKGILYILCIVIIFFITNFIGSFIEYAFQIRFIQYVLYVALIVLGTFIIKNKLQGFQWNSAIYWENRHNLQLRIRIFCRKWILCQRTKYIIIRLSGIPTFWIVYSIADFNRFGVWMYPGRGPRLPRAFLCFFRLKWVVFGKAADGG